MYDMHVGSEGSEAEARLTHFKVGFKKHIAHTYRKREAIVCMEQELTEGHNFEAHLHFTQHLRTSHYEHYHSRTSPPTTRFNQRNKTNLHNNKNNDNNQTTVAFWMENSFMPHWLFSFFQVISIDLGL